LGKLPVEEGTFIGVYTRSRGARRTYTYEAEWFRTGQDIAWRAKVECEGGYCGMPDGVIYSAPDDPTAQVRTSVEAAIENLSV
jgi:hypothetical protein